MQKRINILCLYSGALLIGILGLNACVADEAVGPAPTIVRCATVGTMPDTLTICR